VGSWTITACVMGMLALACPAALAQEGDQQIEQPSSATASSRPTIQRIPQNSHCGGVVRVYMAPPPSWLSDDPVVAGDAIHQRRGAVNALCLFEGAYLLADRDLERAGLLFTMARLRSRYDVARCKQPDGAQSYMSVARSREMSPPPRAGRRCRGRCGGEQALDSCCPGGAQDVLGYRRPPKHLPFGRRPVGMGLGRHRKAVARQLGQAGAVVQACAMGSLTQ